MTPEMMELARRAVACKGWRWMPGMLAFCPDGTNDPVRICFGSKAARMGPDDQWVRPSYIVSHELPDLTDPATLGCMLALVREVWPHERALVPIDMGDGEWQLILKHGRKWSHVVGKSEAEALVAALEVAP